MRGGFLQCQHLTDAISEHSRMTLDYFYGQAGELFSFYRIPKALFQEPRFQSLSTDAKTLYGILLDRMSLSAKNGWLDEQGRVFIMKNRKKACPATKSGPPPATSSRSSRTMPERASSISCWYSCSTVSVVSQMKRPLLWNGLYGTAYRARSGKCWHPGSLRGMVGNLTYMGVLRCGDARSELMPELQIIPQEEFEAAQRIREDRSAHAAEEAEHHVPLRTRGQALLSNNVYCGHCGARLALTTSRKWRKLSDGTLDDTLRIRYTCYGKLRKQTDCTGQTGYTMHILDEIIDKMVRQIFSRLRGIPKEQLITSRYAKETAERKNHLQALQAERDKAEKDLLALKTEILAVIKGESAFPKDTLAEMIAAQEKKHTELDTLCEEASAELERNAELMANVSQLYEELISYADLYDSASFEAKKMIVSQLIRRVEVYRGYQIHVDFNFDLAQYLENSDELAC